MIDSSEEPIPHRLRTPYIIPSVGGLWPGGYDHTRDTTIIPRDTGIKAYRPYKVPDLNETAITVTHIEASKILEDPRSATGLGQ